MMLMTLNLELMNTGKEKIITIVLECIKLVATALIGYFGGNAIV